MASRTPTEMTHTSAGPLHLGESVAVVSMVGIGQTEEPRVPGPVRHLPHVAGGRCDEIRRGNE